MTLLLIFALVLATIVIAIFLQRVIHCPILIGLLFFAVLVLAGALTGNTIFIILAAVLGVIAFISAFLDCFISRCGFFRDSGCLNCDNCNDCNRNRNQNGAFLLNNTSNNCNNNSQPLTILNSNGEIVARINGNNVTCTSNQNDNNSNCGCSRRNFNCN